MPRTALIISLALGLMVAPAVLFGQEKAHGAVEPEAQLSDLEVQYLSDLTAYFEPPEESLEYLLGTSIPKEEYAVLLEVARRSGTSAKTLYQKRARGDSWDRILVSTDLSGKTFYVIISAAIESDTYAPIYAKFAAVPETDWDGVQLTDSEVIAMANLKFISSRHDYSVFDVMKLRDEGTEFLALNAEVKALKDEMIKEEKKGNSKDKQKEETTGETKKDNRRP